MTYRGTDGTLKSVKVQSDENLRNALAEQRRAQDVDGYVSDEDKAIRKKFEEQFGTT